MKHPTIILASASPRRISLLRKIVRLFTVRKSSFKENNNRKLSPMRFTLYNATQKARSIKARNALIIGADTIVVVGRKVLGKPKSKREAREMLNHISGRNIRVITGICVVNSSTGRLCKDYEVTFLKVRKLSPDFIIQYVASGEPMDKAGAFAIQGKGAAIKEKIDGDLYNVVGLPLAKVKSLLKKAQS